MKRFTTLLVFIILGSLQIMLAQSVKVTGKVTDSKTGEPLPLVNVVIKNTTVGSVTDLDGVFLIEIPGPNTELNFSFVGYLPKTVPANGLTVLNVVLEPDVRALGEIVVVGYGSMQRANVTGAIATIKQDEILKAPVANVVEALRGQVAGVRISRSGGAPGSGVEFLIRGKKSIGIDNDGINENEPLIVIDGVPTTGGNIAEINPADIASLDILKDAAAASIYGASGANGVILITTKSGSFGKPSLSVGVSYGFTDLVQKPTLFNGPEYVQLKMDAAEGGGDVPDLNVVLGDPVEMANYKAGKSIDWHDVLLRQGITKNVNISLSGGTDKFKYYMNGDAYLEDGIVHSTSYDRYSFRVNADYSPFKFLNVGAKVQLTKSLADETGNTLYQGSADFTDFLGNTPLGRTVDENGELVPTVKADQFQYNPLFRYRESEINRGVSKVYINPYLEFKIITGLTYRLNTYVEDRNETYREFYSKLYNNGSPNQMRIQFQENSTYLLDNIVNYNKKFFELHSVDATFVYGLQTYDSNTLNTTGQNAATDLLSYYAISDVPSVESTVRHTPDQWAKEYYVGRLGYNYADRYNLTLTLRRDGSSKFGKNNKFGNFPSASFAWNAQNESFLKDNQIISQLKYRVSYGVMGNDRIPNFRFISLANAASYPFNGTVFSGLTTGTAPNESLRWEKSNQLNTGFDFGLLKNRISGTVDYYQTRTTDLLLNELIPITTGFTSVLSNVGETKNWGIDANLTGKVFEGDFNWEINVNWAKDKNEIVKLNRSSVDAQGKPIDDIANGWFIGQDIDVIYNYKYIGVYQLGEEAQATAMHPDIRGYGPGDPKIADINGDGKITFEDQTFLGSPTPHWYGGLRNTFSYKGLELTILFETIQGTKKMNSFINTLTARDNTIKVDYWTPRNPTNAFPQPNAYENYYYADAVRMVDASFVALRNVSLQYSIPQSISKRVYLKDLSVFVRGNNLKYFTDFKQTYSPESAAGAYPVTKTWSFGAKFTF